MTVVLKSGQKPANRVRLTHVHFRSRRNFKSRAFQPAPAVTLSQHRTGDPVRRRSARGAADENRSEDGERFDRTASVVPPSDAAAETTWISAALAVGTGCDRKTSQALGHTIDSVVRCYSDGRA